ncbi:non-ribosomal peptide synthetase [Kitasatospora phosalacinea]|uniref:PhsC n=1 Tax=Kitasatospora phosalacinea TaxID=2065 RepID=A0A0M3WNY7_9ACTN|nr:non-ribosomal peptide synthetase [Kitasatospora phosalacinea]AKO69601.1 PhsC [Kitasatospora phosalacinea]
MSDHERRIGALTPERRALLERALNASARRRGTADPAAPLPRRAGGGPGPLSVGQRRLWFIHQLQPDSPVYHITAELTRPDHVGEEQLRAALAGLAERHEVLRTDFPTVGAEPAARVRPGLRPALSVADLRGTDPAGQAAEADRLRAAALRPPFDLAAGPLWRALLLWTDRGTTVHLVFHHIVFDGWSTGVLRADLTALIDSELTGRPADLAELPVQFGDFAHWEGERLAAGRQDALLAHWLGRLRDAPAAIRLPYDRPHPPAADFAGARREFVLPGTADAVRALARRTGATPFAVLLAAFAALLHRWGGDRDLVVGTPVANRERPELHGLIGFFANTLPLRVRLDPDADYLELLRGVTASTTAALAHQDVPLDRLVERLSVDRDLGRNPLFQVAFALDQDQDQEQDQEPEQNQERERDGGPGPVGERHRPGTSKFDLTLGLAEHGADYRGYLEYSTALFDPVTVDRLVRRWELLLDAVLADPGRAVGDLPVLTEEERELFAAVGTTAVGTAAVGTAAVGTAAAAGAPGPARPIHRMLRDSARRFPDRTAVEDPWRALSYRELDGRSDRLAERLRARGVGREQLVPIVLDRGVDCAVALFAVLKAGAAALPLDPEHPQARLEQVLAEADAPLLVTEPALAGRFGAHRDLLVLEPGPEPGPEPDPAPDLDARPAPDADPDADPDRLAYVIFTSGSTGRPKGVLVPHGGLDGMIRDLVALGGLDERTRVLQFASPGFDASVLELLVAVESGGTAVYEPRRAMTPGADLTELLRTRRIDAALLLPSVLGTLDPDELPGLRCLFTGGEAIDRPAARRWSAGRLLVNLYGPTECSVVATGAPCTGERPPVLGRPLGGRTVHVLDPLGRPVPLGCTGELHLGGTGLARGYLGRPGGTATAFVPDPYSGTPGGRLYRTGDLVRWTPDGELEFQGRRDQQVKLRGFRIELGEVAAHLAAHPAVRSAAADVRELAGTRQLAGYLVPEPRLPVPAPGELRAFLRERVPEHLVPAAFRLLDRLPLTVNGKLDRAALPDPVTDRPRTDTAGPADPVQRQVAEAWHEVLGCGALGPDDNFFEVGGNSLTATRVVAAVNARVGSALRVRALFLAPTVAALAAAAADSASGHYR